MQLDSVYREAVTLMVLVAPSFPLSPTHVEPTPVHLPIVPSSNASPLKTLRFLLPALSLLSFLHPSLPRVAFVPSLVSFSFISYHVSYHQQLLWVLLQLPATTQTMTWATNFFVE
jgi:hypothetical protein